MIVFSSPFRFGRKRPSDRFGGLPFLRRKSVYKRLKRHFMRVAKIIYLDAGSKFLGHKIAGLAGGALRYSTKVTEESRQRENATYSFRSER